MKDFNSYLRAGYPFLWVASAEEKRLIGDLRRKAEEYQCWIWDIVEGLRRCDRSKSIETEGPIDMLEKFEGIKGEKVLFFLDAHRFLEDDIGLIRKLKNMSEGLKFEDGHIVFVSHKVAIPAELQQVVTVFDFDLPGEADLIKIARVLVEGNKKEVEIDEKAIICAKGLTEEEAENSFARSLIEKGKFDREVIEEEKLQVVKKSGLLEIWPIVDIKEIGGLGRLKGYIESRKKGFEKGSGLPRPKGIVLLGAPGTGKSLSCKAIAGVLEMPLVRLDIGALKGGLVGESEENTRKALGMIDAISPCVVWLDEIEKAISGVQSSGKTDGGTSSNMFGQLLTWMQESDKEHFIAATCNDIGDLLAVSQGAILRRFDDVFYVDLPGREERQEIYKIMLKRYGVEGDGVLSAVDVGAFEGWTGAEIEKFVKGALYDGMAVALESVKPISKQNKGKLEEARKWAMGNAIFANFEEAGRKEEEEKGKKKGRVIDFGNSN